MADVTFRDEADGLVMCTPSESAQDKDVYAAFRKHCNISSDGDGLAADAKLLFKITVDNKEKTNKAKPVVFVGVPQQSPFSVALNLCNRTFCATKADQSAEHNSGAFLLQGGYALSTSKIAGNIFMAYGNEVRVRSGRGVLRLLMVAAHLMLRSHACCVCCVRACVCCACVCSSSSTRRSTLHGLPSPPDAGGTAEWVAAGSSLSRACLVLRASRTFFVQRISVVMVA